MSSCLNVAAAFLLLRHTFFAPHNFAGQYGKHQKLAWQRVLPSLHFHGSVFPDGAYPHAVLPQFRTGIRALICHESLILT